MQARQQVQFAIFPRYFSILNFYSKGQYSIRLRVTIQDENKKTTYGFARMFESSEANRNPAKKARIATSGTDSYFDTENFYVNFSEEKIILHTICVFQVEYKVGQKYSTYLDLQLVLTTFKNMVSEDGDIEKKLQKEIIVEKRRLLFNDIKGVATFKRIVFDECDYFSYCDMFLASLHLGHKLRKLDYDLKIFSLMDADTRIMHHLSKPLLGSQSRREVEESLHTHLLADSILEAYQREVTSKVDYYHQLFKWYQYFGNLAAAKEAKSSADSSVKSVWNMKSAVATARSRIYLKHHEKAQKKPTRSLQWICRQFKGIDDLLDHYNARDILEAGLLIWEESQLIFANTRALWNAIIDTMLQVPDIVFEQAARVSFQKERRKRDICFGKKGHINAEQRDRQLQQFKLARARQIAADKVYEQDDIHHPLLIFENFKEDFVPERETDICSLVVFVHGYQGSDVDLQKANDFLKIYNPYCFGMLVKSLQNDMEEDIEALGKLLADEVKKHLLISYHKYKRINFVGYSLGGIVARESLKHLEEFKDKMNVFISFASPHLGITDNSNMLVRLGIWFLTNFDKAKNLKQLTCKPNENDRVTLVSLATCECLSWFSRFVAVSSKDDDFVPYYSSRLDEQVANGQIQAMQSEIMKNIKRLERVDVWFDVDHIAGVMDKAIGRKSHIEFLENGMFLDCFFSQYGPLL